MTDVLTGPSVPQWVRELTGDLLVELLDRAADRTPDRIALTIRRGARHERWTYRQLADTTSRVAATLAEHGVAPGTRVLTWSPNDPWLVAAYFATWRLGAAVVPLDLRMADDVAVRIGRQVEPVVALIGVGVSDAGVEALNLPVVKVQATALDPEGASAAVPQASAKADVGPDTVAEILFTSGTTSDPKGVVLTHGQLVHSGRTITLTAGRRAERALMIIPLSHMYGQIVPLLHGLATGSQLTFLAALTPSALFEALRRDRITVITAFPQLLQILLDAIESEARKQGRLDRLRRLRAIGVHLPFRLRRVLFRPVLSRLGGALDVLTCGGALLRPELQLAWEGMGIRVVQGYGATECAAITGHTRDDRRLGTVGPPLAGIEVRIAEDGEVLARGPNAMLGYWERQDETAEVLADGWVHTGDAGRFDRGELVILGRTRDRIALPNGLKVYPEDVESALVNAGESRPIKSAVVLEATPGQLAAVVLPAAGVSEETIESAVREANAALAPHQRVRRWRRWPEEDFPRTHTLKVKRPVVAEWLSTSGTHGTASAPSSPPAARGRTAPDGPERVLAVVARTLEQTTGQPVPALTPRTRLAELELDSLALVALSMEIEQEFGVALEDQQIAEAEDLVALAKLIGDSRGVPTASEPSRWAFSRPARLARRALDAGFTRPLVQLIARPLVTGLEHLENLERPVLICANHASHLDAPVLRHVLPRRVRARTAIAAAADYFFAGRLLGPAVALATAAFPFGRKEHVRGSLERVGTFVDDGWNVIVFPEGTRSPTGALGVVRPGIGLLATTLDVPIVPAHISGAYEILPKGRALPRRRGRVHVRFGPPLRFGPDTSVPDATARVASALRELAE